MNKKILLGAAISIASMQASAVPFQVFDARSMGMGGTGVASAQISSIVPYNPALLATYRADDHLSVTFPRFGVFGSDEDEFIESVEDFDDAAYFDAFSDTLDAVTLDVDNLSGSLDGSLAGDNGVTAALQNVTTAIDTNTAIAQADLDTLDTNNQFSSLSRFDAATTSLQGNAGTGGVLSQNVIDLNNGLTSLSNKALRGGFGGGVSFAIPSTKFGMSVSIDTNITASGLLTVESDDLQLLTDYTGATSGYVDVSAQFASDLVYFSALTVKFAAFADDPINNPALTAQEEDDLQLFINGADDDATTDDAGSIAASEAAVSNYSANNSNGDPLIVNNEFVGNDADLVSTAHIYGAAVTDIALGIGRMFTIQGKDIGIGITPKLQRIDVFDVIYQLDGEDQNGQELNFDDVEVNDYHVEFTEFNLDAGAAYRFGHNGRWQGGFALKNLIGKTYTSAAGKQVSINPMARVALSYENTDFWLKPKVAVDLDLTENDPIAFEDPTQYFGIGAEIDLFRTLQLRGGYRTNLAGSDQEAVSFGIGFSPFVVHLDFAAFANPSDVEKEAGFAFEMGVEF